MQRKMFVMGNQTKPQGRGAAADSDTFFQILTTYELGIQTLTVIRVDLISAINGAQKEIQMGTYRYLLYGKVNQSLESIGWGKVWLPTHTVPYEMIYNIKMSTHRVGRQEAELRLSGEAAGGQAGYPGMSQISAHVNQNFRSRWGAEELTHPAHMYSLHGRQPHRSVSICN